MSGPAIPYIQLPEIPLSFLSYLPIIGEKISQGDPPTIKPFGTLVALGVYLGSVIALRRAKERGLDTRKLNDFIFWSIGMGFVGAHVLDSIFYYPDKVVKNPLYLLELWAGLSSFGGFTGALLGSFIWKWRNRVSMLAYLDVVCSAFPAAWVFGRSGCSVAHDHPGRMTDLWLGVQYPNLPPGIGRFDLGLIEMLLTIPLAIAFHFKWKSGPKFFGYYAGWMSIVYAPVRFFLDFLRVGPGDKLPADERYFHLTPAQWAAFGLLGLGIYVVRNGKKQEKLVPPTYAEAQARGARGIALEMGDPVPDVEDEDEPAEAPAQPAKPRTKKKMTVRASAPTTEATTETATTEAERGSGPTDAAAVDPAPAGEVGEEVGARANGQAPAPRRRRRRPAAASEAEPGEAASGDEEPEPR